MKLRQLSLVMIFAALLLFSGCSGKTELFTLNNFEAKVVLLKDETHLEGKLTVIGDDISLVLSSPEALEGIKIEKISNEMLVSSGDMTLPFENLSFGEDAFTELFSCISLLSSSSHEVSVQTDSSVILLSDGESEYKIRLVDGQIKEILSQTKGISYSFTYS